MYWDQHQQQWQVDPSKIQPKKKDITNYLLVEVFQIV